MDKSRDYMPVLPGSSALGLASPKTLAEAIASEIIKKIYSGELAPGEAIRIEPLAEALGTSTQPVRQALQLVEPLGLIKTRPRRGAVVRKISLQDAESTYEARLLIEPELLRGSLRNFPKSSSETKAKSELQRLVQHIKDGDLLGWRRAHMNFHWALYESSRSPWLLHAAQGPFGNAERYRLLATPSWNSAEAHALLLDACSRGEGNVETAIQKLREHLTTTLASVRVQLADETPSPDDTATRISYDVQIIPTFIESSRQSQNYTKDN